MRSRIILLLALLALLLDLWVALSSTNATLATPVTSGLLSPIGFRHPAMAALFAILAHTLVAATCALVLFASPAWSREPEFVRDYGWPSMRSLAIGIPVLTFVQAALGAAFRQQLIGLMPHIVGAMVVSLLILMLGAFVLSQFPSHPRLRPAARAMMAVMFAQVFLGIAAFTVRSIPDTGAGIALTLIAGHVITGALTIAATVVLGMLIRREVQPKL